jgi:phage replication-related protein YjqB (UPF0714/DUF867 family)
LVSNKFDMINALEKLEDIDLTISFHK